MNARQRIPALISGCLLIVLLGLPAAANAKPQTAESAIAAYERVTADREVPAGWTGSTASCEVGEESQASRDATLNAVNTFRDFAGLPPVGLNATMNHEALSAALMMAAQNDLEHDPPTSWACYSDAGYRGAQNSNLSLDTGVAAVAGYMEEDDENQGLGHRRWVMDPGAVEFGTGSTGSSNALHTLDSQTDGGARAAAVPDDSAIAWPPAGFVPWPWVFKYWSVAVGSAASQENVSVDNARVSVSMNGTPMTVQGPNELPEFYGTGKALGWTVGIPDSAKAAAATLDVTVDGVTLNGSPLPIAYRVQAVPTEAEPEPPAEDDTVACAKAQRKLQKAKRKLKAAKKHGSRRKARKAKRKKRAAKAAVKALC